jgi:ketosteroid isomerase-like protein
VIAADEVRDAFVRYLDALARGDIKAIDAIISNADETLIIGSDPSEWWQGHDRAVEGLRAIIEQTGGLPVAPSDPQVFAFGDLGWVADRPKVTIPGVDIDFRMSAIFRMEAGDWKLVHLHASRSVTAETRSAS